VPYNETTAIRGNTARIERDGQGARTFTLDRAPDLAVFLSAFGALLAGDLGTLEQSFAIAASGDETGDWTLELTPLDTRVRRRVRMIAINGTADELRCLAISDTNETGSVVLLGDQGSTGNLAASSFEDLVAHCRGR
jgi:hypothetical protein